MMRPFVRNALWIAVAAVALAALAVPKLVSSGRDTERAAPEEREEAALPVEVVEVQPQHLAETLTSTGTIYADERVEVVSEVAGKVLAIDFEEGVPVAAGALLVQIDDRELKAEQERVAARLELAERRAERQRQLYDDGLISDQDFDAATTEADALRAELRLIEVRLSKTQIRTPFAGVVGLRRLSEGAYVSPETLVTTLLDIDPVKLEFAVPERYAADFRPGKQVEFRVAGAGGVRRATVYAVEPSVDPETRTVTVRATSPNPDGALLPGAFADVTFAVRETDDALAVPSIAVLPELGGHRVYVLEDGTARARSVETGLRTADRVEITRGLAVGERVIVSGLQSLRPGTKVEVAGEEAEEAGS
ncbi:MAG: efflux RND transporter periplasmic adaptor subunit [Thermoanaerobaculia bacterium]